MMTRAYDEIYLDDAMENLGSALEYAVLVADLGGQEFLDLFIATEIADEFGMGNVSYISGMSGIELCRIILRECGLPLPEETGISHIDYPAEYWVGWILAYYQWYTGKTFSTICRRLRFAELGQLYDVLHEADPSKAVSVFDAMMSVKYETNLAVLRKNRDLTQDELARRVGVSIRSIQLYEQRQSDINRAKHHHLQSIARVLGCNIEDILE